jgi:hypothetical protein
MRLDQTSDLWWKNAIVYCLDVETYLDTDGDGVGDFQGLIRPTTATTSATTSASIPAWATWASSSTWCARRTTAASR